MEETEFDCLDSLVKSILLYKKARLPVPKMFGNKAGFILVQSRQMAKEKYNV